MNDRLLVSIVTFNSGPYLKACLQSLQEQTFRGFKIVLWDNASTDNSRAIVSECRHLLAYTRFSEENVGFCAAQNRLIAASSSDYVLVLNPDVVLDKRFLEILIREMDADESAGAATGKLWRLEQDAFDPETSAEPRESRSKILDSTGMYLTPAQRHFDRGSGEIDTGQYDRRAYVFGATGAAALYRRIMLEDIRNGSQYFDESFFYYREDADLAWRSQWMGWRCLYVPEATGYHARRVLPQRRSLLPGAINMHSFKNRFLLRIKNMDLGTYARFFIPITLRDAGSVAYVLTREWSSLPGIRLLIRALPDAWAQRKSLQRRRRVSPRDVRSWISYRPVVKEIAIKDRADGP
jgi:GT2 family glycosyltransferase